MPIFNRSSIVRVSLLFSCAIFLAPLNDHRAALVSAVDWGVGPKDPTDGYPSDEEIDEAFKAPGPDESVVFVEIPGAPVKLQPYRYCVSTQKKSIYNAFSENFLFQLPSQRGQPRFQTQCIIKFLRAAVGEVTLLAPYPYGPGLGQHPSCMYWWDYAFPELKENEKVTQITLVNPDDFLESRLYWRRGGPEPDPNKLYPLDNGPQGLLGVKTGTAGISRGGGDLLMGGAGIVSPVVGSAGTLLNGLPSFAPIHDGSKDKISEMDPQWMDMLDQIDQTMPDASFSVLGKTAMTLPVETTELPPLDIFQRRRRRGLLVSSSGPTCLDWSGIPTRGPAPGQPVWGVRPTFNDNPNSNPTTNVIPPQDNREPSFSPKDYFTVVVTQHAGFPSQRLSDNSQPFSNYRLDIKILDPAGQTSGPEVLGADAPSGQAVDANSRGLLSPLQVSTGFNDNDPVSFRLGEQEWDSTHETDDHKCGTSRWADGKRKIVCSFQIQAGQQGPQPGDDKFQLRIDGDQTLSP